MFKYQPPKHKCILLEVKTNDEPIVHMAGKVSGFAGCSCGWVYSITYAPCKLWYMSDIEQVWSKHVAIEPPHDIIAKWGNTNIEQWLEETYGDTPKHKKNIPVPMFQL